MERLKRELSFSHSKNRLIFAASIIDTTSRLMLQKRSGGNLNLNNHEQSDDQHTDRGTSPSE